MSVYEEIKKLCHTHFESLWNKEYERVNSIWREFLNTSKTAKGVKSTSPQRFGRTEYDFRFEDFSMKYLFPDKEYKHLHIFQRQRIVELRIFLNSCDRQGFSKVMKKKKEDWWKSMMDKLAKYVVKFIKGSDVHDSSTISPSEKGYTVSTYLTRDGKVMLFETKCFSAGGTNIQCFHFRYKGSIKESVFQR